MHIIFSSCIFSGSCDQGLYVSAFFYCSQFVYLQSANGLFGSWQYDDLDIRLVVGFLASPNVTSWLVLPVGIAKWNSLLQQLVAIDAGTFICRCRLVFSEKQIISADHTMIQEHFYNSPTYLLTIEKKTLKT